MITARIASGFDLELQLARGWFLTALNLLNDKGVLAPGFPVVITDVAITFEPGADLSVRVLGLADPVLIAMRLSASGKQLILTTNVPGIPEQRIPFDVLQDL